ncbi:schlafen family member 9-like [Patiria miniata]|uniref:Schlafen AlbA-2 domain-containing protein n=1 Tax=Patiria miniata TaxID=46514 RepID=A0A914AFF3_PATMI|nr:schlafen family member 9-like [Patiria miniata]
MSVWCNMASADKFTGEESTMNIHIMNSVTKTKDGAAQRKLESGEIVRMVCAALNSDRREVITLRNVHRDHPDVEQKHLDEWRKQIEQELLKNLRPPQWRECFDFCSQPADAEFLYCYVTPSRRPATVNYNLRLPTDTSTELVQDYHLVEAILSREEDSTATRPFFDFDDHLPKAKVVELQRGAALAVDDNSQSSRHHFRGLLDLKKGDIVGIPESKMVQYKKLKDGMALAANIEKHVSDYFGAFANHEGGCVIIGVEDNQCQVVGQVISNEAKTEIERCLDCCAKRKTWGRLNEQPIRGKHWDVYFHSLEGDLHLVEVRINPFCGGVFQKEPESYTFGVNDKGKRVIRKMKFQEWVEAMLRDKIAEQRRSDEMREKFEMLSTHISGGCKVFALKSSHRDIRERMFPIKEGLHIWPENYISLVSYTGTSVLQNITTSLKDRFASTKGVCVVSQCILADIGIHRPGCAKEVMCDIVVFTETDTPFLVTVGSAGIGLQEYSEKASTELEECLTKHGGEGRFFVKSCCLDLETDPDCIPGIIESIRCHTPANKPASYHQMHFKKLQSLVSALVVAVASFTPETYLYMRDLMGVQVMNLLTPSQLQALTLCNEVPHVYIQGYPGTGKTVIGIERAKRLRLGGAEVEQILYIPSNVQMAKYVRELVFPKSSTLCGEKICLSVAFDDIVWKIKDGTLPESVKYLILDDTQNFLNRRDVPPSNVEEDTKNLTTDMRVAVREIDKTFFIKCFQIDWLECLCIWLRKKPECRMVVISDESQSVEQLHYYQTLREFMRESNGKTVTLNVVIRNSEEITNFFQKFVSTECYGVLPTTAHDFKGERPVMRATPLSPESLRATVKKYTNMGYSPGEITLIRHDVDDDKASLSSLMTTSVQKECMRLYRDIDEQLKEGGIENNGVPGPQVLHAVLFFCLLTKELLSDQGSAFKISLADPCFVGEDTATPPLFLRRIRSDKGRYDAPVRNTVVCMFQEKWQYLCELYKNFVQSGRPVSGVPSEIGILIDRKMRLSGYGETKGTNLQKLYAVSEFLLGPVTVPEHIFRIIDVQHAGVYRLIIFHLLPNVHAIHGTHEVPARGQCVRIEGLESFAGRENQVVIGIMPNEGTLQKYTMKTYVLALASRARTKLEFLSVGADLVLNMCTDTNLLETVRKYYVNE